MSYENGECVKGTKSHIVRVFKSNNRGGMWVIIGGSVRKWIITGGEKVGVHR